MPNIDECGGPYMGVTMESTVVDEAANRELDRQCVCEKENGGEREVERCDCIDERNWERLYHYSGMIGKISEEYVLMHVRMKVFVLLSYP
jgi:hypothetical protein